MSELSRADQAEFIRKWVASGCARQIRLASKVTLTEAGRRMDVDNSAVYRWEKGERAPVRRNISLYYEFLVGLGAATKQP